jgi:putative heme-binding domain-containing protein
MRELPVLMPLVRFLFWVFASCAVAGSATGQDGADEGFRDLFNGSDFSGWSGDLRFWTVEDGAITGRSSLENPLTANTFLAADGVYGDFELRLQFRIVGGNPGVQYRSRLRDDGSVAGYQADIDAGPNYTGILYEENGRGILCDRGAQVDLLPGGERRDAGSIGDKKELQSLLRSQDWNDYEIVARGPRLIHRINGRVFVDVVDRDESHAASGGRIALQIHSGPPMSVQFRAIRLREIYAPVGEPQWVWSATPAAPRATCEIRRRFELPAAPRQGWLRVSCDNRHVTFVNGVEVGRGDEWQRPDSFFVTEHLRAGANELVIAAANDGGPAALAAILDVEMADGSMMRIRSTDRFEARDTASDPWRPVATFGGVSAPAGPWPNPFGSNEATPASDIEVPPGFVVERVASAKRHEGSWVALTFDPKGRLVISPQSGDLLRVTLPEAGGSPRVEPLPTARRIGDAQGLLFAHGSLYVSVNSDSKEKGGLWRCRDEDGDDRFEIVERLIEYTPGGEHGGHGLALGPDGLLYLMLGNHTEHFDGSWVFDTEEVPPKAFAATSPLRHYAEDLALKREWDPNGHAVNILAPGGYVVRFDRDASSVELFSGGYRNAYDLAFSPDGELFTYDSDMEWDIGLPWYRPTRVCHVTSGSDFGWRSGSGNPPSYYPDSLGPVVDVGLGSPTGVTFATNSNYPAPYRSAFFIADWTYGRIYAVNLEPDGSSYRGTFTTFAEGKPLNVTDLEFGPDGALWFITGGRGTQSGLYRIAARTKIAPGPTARHEQSDPARAARRALEAAHAGGDSPPLHEIFDALDAADRFHRFAARVALERRPVDSWRARALAETRPRAFLESMLALARLEPRSLPDLADAIARSAAPATTELLLCELRVLQVAFARGGTLDPDTNARLLLRYDARYPSRSFPENRELYAVLRRLDAAGLTARGVALLEGATDPAERIWHAWVLRDAEQGWTAELQQRYRAAGESLRQLSGGHSFGGFLDLVFGAAKRDRVELAPLSGDAPKWTMANLTPELAKIGNGRDFASGKAAYKASLCATCHRVGKDGGVLGPDLTGVSGRFSRRDLLEAIVEPSKVISDQYATTDFVMKDGSKLVGRVVDQDFVSLVLNVDPLNPRRVTINKADVASKSPSRESPMPARLIDVLTLEQVLDLMAYLESGGNPNSAHFRK